MTDKSGADGAKRTVSRRDILKHAGVTAVLSGGLSVPVAGQSNADDLVHVPGAGEVPKSKVVANDRANLDLPAEAGPTTDEGGSATYSSPSSGASPSPSTEYDGWAAHATMWLPDGHQFSTHNSKFQCPSRPKTFDPGLVHFYFPSFTSDGNKVIVQPVLAWNWGRHDDWKLAAWWGPDSDSNYHHSPFVDVSPGDTIENRIRILDEYNPSRWYVEIVNRESGEYTDIVTDGIDNREFRRLDATLEIKNFTEGECDKLPGDGAWWDFKNTDMRGNTVSLDWQENIDLDCLRDIHTFAPSEPYIAVH